MPEEQPVDLFYACLLGRPSLEIRDPNVAAAEFKAVYPSDHRSVYLMVQRLHPHPYLALFNGPDPGMTTAVRDMKLAMAEHFPNTRI